MNKFLALQALLCGIALSGCGGRAVPEPLPLTLYAASYGGGVYRSGNGGVSWVDMGDQAASFEGYVKRLAWGPRRELLVATSGSGIFCREGDGFRPLRSPGAGEITAMAADESSASLWIGTGGNGVFFSRDGGESWREDNEGLDFRRVAGLAVDSSPEPVLYCATDGGLFRRSPGGSWEWMTRELGIWDARAVELGPPPQPRLLLGGSGVGGPPPILVSADGAVTWETGGRGLPDGNVFQLVGTRGVEETVFFAATSRGVYRSRDSGIHWDPMGKDGPARSVLALTVAGNHLFAGGEEGLFRIPLAGGRWRRTSRGLPQSTVTSLLASP